MLNKRKDINKVLEAFICEFHYSVNEDKTFMNLEIALQGNAEQNLSQTVNIKKIDYEMTHNILDDYGCIFADEDFVFENETTVIKQIKLQDGDDDVRIILRAGLRFVPFEEMETV